MYHTLQPVLQKELAEIENAGLTKRERIITSAQGAEITIAGGQQVINFCANNYLGLSSHPKVIEAAKQAIDTHGFGMSSVRFICGTQNIHKQLISFAEHTSSLSLIMPTCMSMNQRDKIIH